MLTHGQAKKFYDLFGAKQDKQFYEKSAINELVKHGGFIEAKNVIEFGCGTGKLAFYLLNNVLPNNCQYTGFDISQTMVDLCRKNIALFSGRARCYESLGEPIINLPDNSVDHFVSTYVLDLLSEEDIHALLNSAYNILSPRGYLCLAGITHGVTPISRIVESIWKSVFRINPKIVGGCRPIKVSEKLDKHRWEIIFSSTVISYGIPSEVLVARKK